MESDTVVAVVSAAIASTAAVTAIFQVVQARRQTRIQEILREDALQPQVWVDIRPDATQGGLFQLAVGNSGRTTAQNVRVTVDRSLPATDGFEARVRDAEAILAEGLASLTPGRTHLWPLGVTFRILDDENDDLVRAFTVNAVGPFGPMPTSTQIIAMRQWASTTDQPTGSLHQVRRAIEALDATLKKRKPNAG